MRKTMEQLQRDLSQVRERVQWVDRSGGNLVQRGSKRNKGLAANPAAGYAGSEVAN